MKIFITRIIPAAGIQLLRDAGHQLTTWEEKRELTPEELVAACKQHDALLSAGPNKLDAQFLETCRHLKAISLLAVGYDNVDIAAATRLGIPVGNTPGVLSDATANIAFLLMQAVSRKAFYGHNTIAKDQWKFYEPTANLGQDLEGKTLGIFGMGRIGMAMAKKCIGAFDMQVIYHNRKPNPAAAAALGARFVAFDELLQQSDVLSLHADLSPQTKGLFNAAAFSKMKPSSIFINTARGAMHNEADLLQALQTQQLWGAGLDVTNPEPMHKDNPLLQLPNVCVLPHIGSATKETRDAMSIMTAENIIAALAGRKMPNGIN